MELIYWTIFCHEPTTHLCITLTWNQWTTNQCDENTNELHLHWCLEACQEENRDEWRKIRAKLFISISLSIVTMLTLSADAYCVLVALLVGKVVSMEKKGHTQWEKWARPLCESFKGQFTFTFPVESHWSSLWLPFVASSPWRLGACGVLALIAQGRLTPAGWALAPGQRLMVVQPWGYTWTPRNTGTILSTLCAYQIT